MSERRRWGKAGVQLTDAEARRNDVRYARNRNAPARRRVADDQIAYRKWAAGLMSPARITFALDAKGLYGPEVDEACKASEPDVDLWEAGKLYPTWEQVLALAQLTGCFPRFFMDTPQRPAADETSLRYHVPPSVLAAPEPPTRFTAEALAALDGDQ